MLVKEAESEEGGPVLVITPSLFNIIVDVSSFLPLRNAIERSLTTVGVPMLLNLQYKRSSSSADGFSMANGHCCCVCVCGVLCVCCGGVSEEREKNREGRKKKEEKINIKRGVCK